MTVNFTSAPEEELWQRFKVGIDYYLDNRVQYFISGDYRRGTADLEKFWQLCRAAFDRLLSQGEGRTLKTKNGEIYNVAAYANYIARGALALSWNEHPYDPAEARRFKKERKTREMEQQRSIQ